ncbi:MAG: hypothetical protein P8P53_01195 [Tateyamaria sp.]|nr:hypothetical protein [Tateyamaria sp.]
MIKKLVRADMPKLKVIHSTGTLNIGRSLNFGAEKLRFADRSHYFIIKSKSGFRYQAKYLATDTTVISRYWMMGLT